jgi:hypothetical protein
MSIAKFDEWRLPSGTIPQTMVQFVPVQSTPVSSTSDGTLVNLSTNNSVGYGSLPQFNTGLLVGSTSFTPLYNNSIIMLHTSHISMNEKSNVSDDFRLSAFADQTLLGWRSSGVPYWHFASNLNAAHFNLHLMFNSWGTDTRTITVRADSGGGFGDFYHFNGRYTNSSSIVPPVQWYLMEFYQG